MKTLIKLSLLSIFASSPIFAMNFVVGNRDISPSVTVTCEGNVINEMNVQPGTEQSAPIKYVYDPSALALQPTCHFNSGGSNLGSITLRLVLDKASNDIMSAFVAANNLQKRYAEVTQTNQKISIYFHND